MNNKDNGKLRKSLIICGVFMVIILALYIGSVFINSNVAKKMNGKVLFTTAESNVVMYDFDKKEELIVAKSAKEAVFYNDGIAYIGTDKEDNDTIYMYDCDKENTKKIISLEGNVEFKTISVANKEILALYEDKDEAENIIISVDKDGRKQEVVHVNGEITDICFDEDEKNIYYAVSSDKDSYVHSIMLSGAGDTEIFKAEDIAGLRMNCYDKNIYLTENESGMQKAAVYKNKTKKAEVLKFSSDDTEVADFVPITGSKFIALCSDNATQVVYVCNGSNKVILEQLKDYQVTAVTDYIQ